VPQFLFAVPIKQIGMIVAPRLAFTVSSHCSKSFLPGGCGGTQRRALRYYEVVLEFVAGSVSSHLRKSSKRTIVRRPRFRAIKSPDLMA
jgi:hypothetical protein